jgi:hypothetical protein
LAEGFALIGDISKYTTMSFKEFHSLVFLQGQIKIRLESIAGEKIQLLMVDDNKMKSINVNGAAYNKIEKEFLDDPPSSASSNIWYYDKLKAVSLLNLEFDQDGIKEITIQMKSPEAYPITNG